MDRRTYLSLAGVAGIGGFAGCLGSDDETTTTATTTSTRPSTTTTERTTETTTATTPEPAVFDGGGTAAFVEALRDAEAGSGVLQIADGTYRLEPVTTPGGGSQPHAEFERVEGVTVVGNGATLVFTDPSLGGLRFFGGGPITIRDLRLDYDPVPFTQGTITGLSNGGRTIDLRLDDGYVTPDHAMFERADGFYTLIHRPDGSFIRGVRKRGNWDHHISSVSKIDDATWRLRLTEYSSTEGLAPGRKLSVLARNNQTALSFYQVTNPVLENVVVHAANGAAFSTGVCEAPVYRNCGVHPPADSNRHIGANADGIRIINCTDSNRVEGCRHEALGDDSLVVQHTLTRVTELVDDQTVKVANVHPFVVTTGDTLDVLTPSGERHEDLPPVDSYEKRFETPGVRNKPVRITFAGSIDDRVQPGDFLRNRATGSQHFTVRDNEFRDHRANLIRVAASHGIIANNVLDGCSISPIELETDTGGAFSPKGWVRDVTVRNNRMTRAGLNYVTGQNPAAVHVHHKPPRDADPTGRPNSDIRIEENRIANGAAGGIRVEAAETVTISKNELQALNLLDYGPQAAYAFGLRNVHDATLAGNRVIGSSSHLEGFGWTTETRNVTTSGNAFILDGDSIEPTLLEWE